MKIVTIAEMPTELSQKWLQHLRDFDTANPGCHFQVVARDLNISMEEAMRMLGEIDPPLDHKGRFW